MSTSGRAVSKKTVEEWIDERIQPLLDRIAALEQQVAAQEVETDQLRKKQNGTIG
jgi:hypothetical protein